MASQEDDTAPSDGRASSERRPAGPAGARASKRLSRKLWLGLFVLFVPLASLLWSYATYPSDRTPEGAYLRVVTAVNRGKPEEFFAYTEETAQHAAYTIRDFRKKAQARILATYPEPEKSRWAERYRRYAEAPDGSDVFAIYARERGWLDRLRRDMSGIERVEIQGERASVLTARATRYPFRRRPNGIWGLTLFTATLNAEAERAARDYQMVEKAAADYERAKRH